MLVLSGVLLVTSNATYVMQRLAVSVTSQQEPFRQSREASATMRRLQKPQLLGNGVMSASSAKV